jgi:hypothetical protein
MGMAMAITDIELYEVLKAPLGESGAKAIVNFVESKVEYGFQQKMQILATKQDLAETKADIIKWMFIFLFGQAAAIITAGKLL